MSTRAAAPDMKMHLVAIERTAASRGLVLEHRGEFVTDEAGAPAPEGDRFCLVAGAAWAATDGLSELMRSRHAHVGQIVTAVARSATDRTGGPVRVSRTAWVLLKSYATTGRPPQRDGEAVAAAGGRASRRRGNR